MSILYVRWARISPSVNPARSQPIPEELDSPVVFSPGIAFSLHLLSGASCCSNTGCLEPQQTCVVFLILSVFSPFVLSVFTFWFEFIWVRIDLPSCVKIEESRQTIQPRHIVMWTVGLILPVVLRGRLRPRNIDIAVLFGYWGYYTKMNTARYVDYIQRTKIIRKQFSEVKKRTIAHSQGYKCLGAYCDKSGRMLPPQWSLDHIIPLFRVLQSNQLLMMSGQLSIDTLKRTANETSNLQILCVGCHAYKTQCERSEFYELERKYKFVQPDDRQLTFTPPAVYYAENPMEQRVVYTKKKPDVKPTGTPQERRVLSTDPGWFDQFLFGSKESTIGVKN